MFAMKTKIERFVLILLFIPLAPIAGLLGFWWTSYALLPERWIPFCAISGLALGVLVDILILKKLVSHIYQIGVILWAFIFLFYTIGVFGLFMGMPVFNYALAIPAGFIVGGRLAREMADQSRVKTATSRTCIFTTMILTFVCAASAFFALKSSSTPSDLRGMLGLGFEVTPVMIWGLILVGGAGLLAVNWMLTGLTVRFVHIFLAPHEPKMVIIGK
jgi:hypothetical protein